MQRTLLPFQEFVEDLDSASDLPAVQRTIEAALNALEFPVFAYVGEPRRAVPEAPLIIATYPDGWAARYAEMTYHRFDAVLASATTQILPFDWGSPDYLARLAKLPRRIFNEAGEFGIARGFTVPIHDVLGQVGTLNVATRESEPNFHKNLAEHRALLHLMGIYLHAHVQRRVLKRPAPIIPRLAPREIECLKWCP